MKKILFISLFLLISVFSKAQEVDFPRYYIVNGDTVGLILSIEQAQKVYNQEILLDLMKDLRHGCDSLVKKYYVIVNKYEKKQLVDQVLIEQYEKNLKSKEETTLLMAQKSGNYETEIKKCDEEKKLANGKVEDLNKIVDQLKSERKWLIGGTVGFGALSLFILGLITGK